MAGSILATEAIAKGYCKKPETLLRNYSDKAHGLTDAQKIEAQECFTLLSDSPGASMTEAVRRYLAHRAQAQRSVMLQELVEWSLSHKQSIGGRGGRHRDSDIGSGLLAAPSTGQAQRGVQRHEDRADGGRLAGTQTWGLRLRVEASGGVGPRRCVGFGGVLRGRPPFAFGAGARGIGTIFRVAGTLALQ